MVEGKICVKNQIHLENFSPNVSCLGLTPRAPEYCGISKTRVANELGVSPMAVLLGVPKLTGPMSDDSDLEKKVNAINFKL